MGKHTAGPWEIRHYELTQENIITALDDDEKVILKLCHAENDEVTEANAHLIAAAPELLEALEAARKTLEAAAQRHCHCGVTYVTGKRATAWCSYHVAARTTKAAIAKAKGEA